MADAKKKTTKKKNEIKNKTKEKQEEVIETVEITKAKKKETNGKNIYKNKVASKEKKNSLWVNFRIFCHGVKSEFSKVHWPSKKDMVKYSVSTIFFIIFCALFFYIINIIFALIQSFI